jgi:hypothetical protein
MRAGPGRSRACGGGARASLRACGALRVVDEEFELLLLLKGVVHLNLLFELRTQVVLHDFSSASLLPKPVWRLELDLQAHRRRARSVSRRPENRLTQPLRADCKPMCVNECTGHRPSAAQVFELTQTLRADARANPVLAIKRQAAGAARALWRTTQNGSLFEKVSLFWSPLPHSQRGECKHSAGRTGARAPNASTHPWQAAGRGVQA